MAVEPLKFCFKGKTSAWTAPSVRVSRRGEGTSCVSAKVPVVSFTHISQAKFLSHYSGQKLFLIAYARFKLNNCKIENKTKKTTAGSKKSSKSHRMKGSLRKQSENF